MAGESRTELIGWLNDLLQLNYTKVEQCGTGGAYCQILDSIYGTVLLCLRVDSEYKTDRRVSSFPFSLFYLPVVLIGDVAMTKVKMNAKHEYEYLANYKVVQEVFKKKKIDKVRCLFRAEAITHTILSL
jgi:RP/EB family microtubule-associated protein